MPRNVKESDDECETKGGRRTRTMLNPSVLDSPLRRSSRIRQPVAPNDLSPEYNSDVSVTSGTKSTRRRTTALDTINPETQKNLRTRRNSATSDISELAENDSAVGSTGKRITRRSIATIPSVDAPSKLPPKTRRSIRAGSETKSTPPVGRVTRRTRASSMEPEVTDNTRSQKGDTPPKLRKRASAMPSEPAVAEESEDSRIDKTVFDIDEDESETSPNVSKSSCRKSKGDTMEDEKIEVDETHESPVRGTNAEESLKESDATEKRRSVGKSGNEPAENKKHVETNEESDGMRVFESDDGSESIVCPSFQDIPADEWADRENNEDNAKSNNDGDSIHSYSTERNESECDIALVDKEPWQPSERNERVNIDENTNYDSDDTIIAKFDTESNIFVEIGGKRVDGKKVSEDERVNEETPMDVSSDAIDDNEQEESNVSKKAPKKRSSLDNSMKHRNENEKILENRASKSPLNVSRRKSLVEDDVNDSVDPIANSSNESLNKSLKKRSLNALQQNENSSDDECNFEINESKKPPKSEPSSRKSLLGSAKKSDSSILDVSNPENRKSLNKYGLDSQEIEGFATEEIEKKSRRSESKRNSLNNSKVEQASLDFDNEEENDSSEKLNKSSKSESNRKSMNSRRNSNAEEIADLTENLNQSSKSESNRKSMNSRRNSKNAEETANPSENLNKSSKSDSIQESLDNGKDTDVELESSGSEIDKFENLLQQLNESTKSINSRKLLNNKNSSKIQEQSSDSGSEEDTDSPAQLNRSTKSTSDRKSLNNKNTSTIQEQNSDSKIEEDNDSQAKMNRSSILTSDRKSLNKNTSKIQEQSSESEIEEETVKLNRSSKLTSDRKLLNNKNTPKIQEQSSDSEIEEDKANLNRSSKSTSDRKSLNNKNTSKVQEQSSESEMEKDKAKLNRSSKSTSDRKSLNNKNTSKIQEQSSDSEMEEETDSQAKLNRLSKSTSDRKSLNSRNSSKIQEQSYESEIEEETAKLTRSSKSTSDRKSLNNKNTSKIQEQSSDSEMEEETDSQAKLNRSSKSTSDRKSLNNKNTSKIQEQCSESEIEEDKAKLNRSSKSTSDRKSLNNKNTSEIQEQSSVSEMEEETDSQAKLNRSSKSTSDRKSLNSRNSSKIQEQSSESEIGEETAKLNRSSKSTSDRKSLTNKRSSKIREQSSDSEMEQENDSQAKMNRSSKSSIIEIEEDYNSQVNQSSKPKRKSLIKNKGSITEPVDSENDSESGSSQNANNLSQKLPLFLHEANTSSAEEDSENSIDADIANEINLHGKSSLVYSDDDVAGDDCMVTESESNDSEDDDGEDLKDFVVNDDEYDSEEYRELELGDDEHESSKKARKVKNKKRKRIIPPPKRDSDSSDSENEEETSKPLKTSFSKDDSLKQIETPTNKKINESLKAKNTKSPISSSTLESDEDSQRLQVTSSSAEKSKTPKNSNKGNDSIQLIEEVINLNESVQRPTKKMQKLLSHSSTPKLSPHKKKTLENLNSSKSAKLEASKLETSRKSSESENNPTVDTPAKLSMNSKETKTPKTTKSQLHTSLPTELNVSEDKTILSNVKSPKLSALHHTMTTIVGDMSETRFLMKEKLNESLPTLKLAQRAKELRRSALYKLWEEKYQKDENEKENVATIAEQSIIEAIVEPEVAHVEKKKKNKKKKKGSNKEVVEDPVTLNESQQSLDTDVTSKKSKKRKKNKKQVETMEIEETEVNEPEEVPKKKKQKKPKLESNEEIVQEVLVEKKKKEQERNVVEEIVEGPKSVEKKKKKKKKKQVTIVEPEVTIEDSSKTPKKSKTENTMNTGNIKIIKSVTAGNSDKLPTSIKRLPEDILDSLSHSFERPKKRRKIVKGEQIILPSKRMFNPGGETSTNIKVDDDYISLSSFGGTTQFQSVDLSKLMKKTNKKSTAVQSFRERMLSRNPRQPISAYLMYQQKQKIAGKDKLH